MDPSILWVALPTAAAVLIVTAILLYLYNSGICTSPEVDVGTPRIRDATIMYKISKGPYQNAGPAFEAIAKLAPKKCLIGLYYDDPDTVPAADLRWAAGVMLAEGKEKVDPELRGRLEAAGYKTHRLPCADLALRATSDVSTKLGLILAIKRTYDGMTKYMTDKKFEEDLACVSVEVYEDCNTMTIMFPLDHTEGFFVPGIEKKK